MISITYSKIFNILKKVFGGVLSIIFALLIIVIATYSGVGIMNLAADLEFIKYLITISFGLAGFTFLGSSLIKKDGVTAVERNILSICIIFILSGLFLLSFIALPNIRPYNSEGSPTLYYNLIRTYYPIMGFFGIFFLSVGLAYLIIVLMGEINRINQKVPEEKFFKKTRAFFNILKKVLVSITTCI